MDVIPPNANLELTPESDGSAIPTNEAVGLASPPLGEFKVNVKVTSWSIGTLEFITMEDEMKEVDGFDG